MAGLKQNCRQQINQLSFSEVNSEQLFPESFHLLFATFLPTSFWGILMDHSPRLRGFRKRWARSDDAQPVDDDTGSQDLFGALETVESQSIAPSPSEPLEPASVDVEELAANSLNSAISSHVSQIGVATAFSVMRSRDIKMPWERGPLSPLFTRRFSDDVATSVKPCRIGLRDVLMPSPRVYLESRPLPTASFSAVNKRIAKCRIHLEDDELRTKALNQFKVLIAMDLQATQLGQSISNVLGNLDTAVDPLRVLRDATSNKATGTLLKRASAMWRFACWLESNSFGTCFDQSEQNLYAYMNYLRDSGAAPTSAAHFVEALRFCNQVFKCQKMDISAVLSTRVTGASHSMFIKKRKLTQAPLFPVRAVQIFEDVCLHAKEVHKRVIAGALLFCIFACVRWFDAMRIENLDSDKYSNMLILEASTSRHKTSMSKESKTRLLPYTSLGMFLDEHHWGESFISARASSGLDEQTLFLPSWNEVGASWSSYPMSSGECTCWIREFLEEEFGEKAMTFSSHGCKATLLTWAGMTTLFSREERTLLGHHVEPQTRASTTYSRDSQILLQYKVSKLISLIKSQQLQPDASRAQRLSMLLSNDESSHSHLARDQVDLTAELVNSDDSDDHYVDDDAPLLHVRPLEKDARDPVPEEANLNKWFVHSYTGMVHGMMPGTDLLACGRRVTVNLNETSLDQIDVDAASMCIQCNAAIKRGDNS